MKHLTPLSLLVATTAMLAAGGVRAAHVEPVTMPGNFTGDCSQLGADLVGGSSQSAPVDPQTYDLGNGHSITFDYDPDGQNRFLDFSATLPMDYIVIKAGDSYNVYHYDPAVEADDQLHGPLNANGQPAGVSHVAWCFLPKPVAGKTAAAEWDRHTDWTLEKAVTPENIHMFDGDTHQVEYTVTVAPTSHGIYRVWGSVTVTDPFGFGWDVAEVSDAMQFNTDPTQFTLAWDGAGGNADTMACDKPAPNPQNVILTCSYGFELSGDDYPFLANASGGVNAVGVTATRNPGGYGTTVSANAMFAIPAAPANSFGDTLSVDDNMLPADPDHVFPLGGPYVWTYPRPAPFACGADEGQHVNTATGSWSNAEGTSSASDSATVNVACETVEIGKTATTRYDRDHGWSAAKMVVVDETDALVAGMQGCLPDPIAEGGIWDGFLLCEDIALQLSVGGVYDTVYRLAGTRAIEDDHSFAVSGQIQVTWPAALSPDFSPATPSDTLTFTDAANGTQQVVPACGAAMAGSLSCSYDAALPRDFVPGNNVAAITRVKKCYDAQGVATDCGTMDYLSDPVALVYGSPNAETDTCVLAEDLFNGIPGLNLGAGFNLPLGEQCGSFVHYLTGTIDGNSFSIHADWLPPEQTGGGNSCEFMVPNLLTLGTDNGQIRSDEAVVTVSVPLLCENGGCTYTQGYWKTHSANGPAPYDETWAQIGEDTLFFASNQSWYQVFWTPPQKGNAYYLLAHQYMAAVLNVEAGASTPGTVQAAIAQAEAWFTGRSTDAPKGNDRTIAIELAGLLADYNEGQVGPGHCSISPATRLSGQ